MKKKALILGCVLLFFLTSMELSFAQESGVLQKIQVSQIGQILEVKIVLSHYSYHRQFKLYNPSRVGIDIFNIRSIQTPQRINVNALGIKAIRVSSVKPDIARLMFDLTDEIPPYVTERFEGGLRILFWAEEAPPPPLPKVTEEIAAAICDIRVEPLSVQPNQPFTIDMSGTQNAEAMVVDVFDASGAKIATQELAPESPRWEFSLDQPGQYTVIGKAFNVQGKQSENACEARVLINSAPVSRLECKRCDARAGKIIVLDASGSTDPDGKVAKVVFEANDEEGNLVDSFAALEEPFLWEKSFAKKGIYSVSAVAIDNLGAISEPARVEVLIRYKKLYIVVDAAGLAARGQGTYVGYAAGRLGILYRFSRKLDIIIAGGGGYTPIDSDPWEHFTTASLILNMHAGPVFIGLGGGYTSRYKTTIQNGYGELITNLGFDLFSSSKMAGSIFMEASGPVVDLSTQKNHKFMLGFRLVF